MIDGLRRIVFRSLTLAIMHISMPRVALHEFSIRETPNLESVTFSYVDLWRIPTFTVGKRIRELGLKLPIVDSPSPNIFLVRYVLLYTHMSFDSIDQFMKILLFVFTCI
jgi:hypothetical protein